MYESRAYDKANDDGFPPDPVVVLVVSGTHDVSRLLNLFNGDSEAFEGNTAVGRQLREILRQSYSQRTGHNELPFEDGKPADDD